MKLLMKRNYGVTAEAKPWLAKDEVVDTEEMGISHEEAVSLLANNRAVLAPDQQADQIYRDAPEKAVVNTPEKRTRRKKVSE